MLRDRIKYISSIKFDLSNSRLDIWRQWNFNFSLIGSILLIDFDLFYFFLDESVIFIDNVCKVQACIVWFFFFKIIWFFNIDGLCLRNFSHTWKVDWVLMMCNFNRLTDVKFDSLHGNVGVVFIKVWIVELSVLCIPKFIKEDSMGVALRDTLEFIFKHMSEPSVLNLK